MKNVLLAAAAAMAFAVPAAPAAAQFWHGIGQAPPSGPLARQPAQIGGSHSGNRSGGGHHWSGGSGQWSGGGGNWDGGGGNWDGRMRGGGRDVSNTSVVQDWYGGEWALYNNRTFDSDSYNDWWHDRPDRAYPRWLSHNQGCERMWFSGDVLHC
jgi:opacity protein-like surface antigen